MDRIKSLVNKINGLVPMINNVASVHGNEQEKKRLAIIEALEQISQDILSLGNENARLRKNNELLENQRNKEVSYEFSSGHQGRNKRHGNGSESFHPILGKEP